MSAPTKRGIKKTSGAILLASTILTHSGSAFAQETVAGENDVIIVTAQRREENLQKVPISIQAIGEAKLEQQQVASFDDYQKLLPSVTSQSFGPSQAQIFFRGITSGADGLHAGSLPTSSMYVDEIPLTSIGGTPDFHVYDVSRVEALAGPQGTLFGASSLSGTLRLITNKPDLSKFEGGMDAEINKFGKGDWGGQLEGFVNLPLSDMAALRVVGFYTKDGGYIDNVPGVRTFTLDDDDPNTPEDDHPETFKTVNNSALVKKNFNDNETYGGRAALKIDLDDNWTVTPQVIYQRQKSHGSFLFDPDVGDLKVQDFLPSKNLDRWGQASLTIEGKLSDWDVVYAGGYFKRKVNNTSDYSQYSVVYDQYLYSSNAPGYATYYPDGNGGFLDPTQNAITSDKYTKQTHELRVSSPSDKPFRLTAGLFFQRQTDFIKADYEIQGIGGIPDPPAGRDGLWISPFPGISNGNTVYLTRLKRIDRDYAAFAQAEYDIVPTVTLTAGVREYIYDNTMFGFSGTTGSGIRRCTATPVPKRDDQPCINTNVKAEGDGRIFKFGAKWQATPRIMFYSTWSRGFRPGGTNRNKLTKAYEPDILDNYEIGWKTQFGRVYFNGAAFYEKWKGIQYALIPVGQNGQTSTFNIGNARVYGIEGDVSARFGGLVLSAAGTYIDAKLTTPVCEVDETLNINCSDPTANQAAKGTRLPVTPKLKGNATARYEIPIGVETAFVQVSMQHQSGARPFLADDDNIGVGRVKGFTSFDFSMGSSWKNFDFQFYIQNVFDKRGELGRNQYCGSSVFDPDGALIISCGQFARTYPIKPQLFGLKVGTKF
jgi:outer membrane receptor protein involved in Fe transport